MLSGRLVGSPEAAAAAVRDLGQAEVLKHQVPAGGRGKAGGIAFVAGEAQATAGARRLLGTMLRGYLVAELLVEQREEAEQEYYLGITYDPVDRRPGLLASAAARRGRWGCRPSRRGQTRGGAAPESPRVCAPSSTM